MFCNHEVETAAEVEGFICGTEFIINMFYATSHFPKLYILSFSQKVGGLVLLRKKN